MWPTVRWLVPGLLIGGSAGALVADRMSTDVLRYGVSIFCMLAAVQLALPEANPSLYLTCSLAITFPFNITLGLPLYQAMAHGLYG